MKDIGSIRTDLAMEIRELYKNGEEGEVPGVAVDTQEEEEYTVTRVEILNENGVEAMGKPIGNYITIEAGKLYGRDDEFYDIVAEALSKELVGLIQKNKDIKEGNSVLVVGLGNWNVTPDALGPRVIDKIMVTRHIIENMPEYYEEGVRSVAAISPGVLGTTGIETSEIVEGVIHNVKPDLVITIDALASRKAERLNSTIQICDTGISPGSGLGNKRKEINKQILKVPVISIGVPTVVDAATLASDTIDSVLEIFTKENEKNLSTDFSNNIRNVDKERKIDLLKSILSPYIDNLVVTPKEIDEAIENISSLIADGINHAMSLDYT